ncbi:hypothetical protein VPH35_060106 [Triticum aestivum]
MSKSISHSSAVRIAVPPPAHPGRMHLNAGPPCMSLSLSMGARPMHTQQARKAAPRCTMLVLIRTPKMPRGSLVIDGEAPSRAAAMAADQVKPGTYMPDRKPRADTTT